MRELDASGQPATAEQQQVLARWSSWGAVPQVFDEANAQWASERTELRGLLTTEEWRAARRTTLNAHYTDPAIVSALWQALSDLGFEGGRVLEPGSGAGTFIGMAPAGAEMTGVELDPMTARISQLLYPSAEIRNESFADTRVPNGWYDAAVGNVPFATTRLHDPANPQFSRFALHNYFILKSLEATRPGGMVAVLSSAFTLDAAEPGAREAMHAMADLVGAVRLPAGALRRSAGTEVVTDVLLLRRRMPGEARRDYTWLSSTPREVDGLRTRINAYYDEHTEHMLGQVRVGQGMYGDATMRVVAEDLGAVPDLLRERLAAIATDARAQGLTFTALSEAQRQEREAAASSRTPLWDGTIVADGEGFKIASNGTLSDFPVRGANTTAPELRALLGLRDQARELLELQAATTATTPEMTQRQAQLRTAWEAYVARYGPINRFNVSAGRPRPVLDELTDKPVLDEAGQPVMEETVVRRRPLAVTRLRSDPHAALVMALEIFDDQTQTAVPSALLTGRVLEPRTTPERAESPADALAMSLDTSGEVDLPLIAGLLETSEETARDMLGTLVFDDPAEGRLVAAEEYLSGNVRTKLALAQTAAATDPRYRVNVEALERVIPEDIRIEQIEARLGATWISPQIHADFLREILAEDSITVVSPLPGEWRVDGARWSVRATNEWGTPEMPAGKIAERLMEQAEIVVKVRNADDKLVVAPEQTAAAQEKAAAMQDRFAEWVWENPERATELARVYNERFNSLVLRDYTRAGENLTLPGLVSTISLRPHQRAAVARMLNEPAVGLFHGVGAGKTLEMIVGVTELRRLGLVSKPCVVVPNHMLEQFSREWLQAYPGARILAASSDDLTKDARRAFVARAAANDWDGIVLTQGAFKAIGISESFKAEYIAGQGDDLRAALESAREAGDDPRSVKRIEGAIQRHEEKLKKALDIPQDPGITFEATGIDYLVVDEAHMYKNLATVSRISDASIRGSEKSADLHMKLEFLRERFGARVATLATATPLANSVTEAHVMQRYLRPDLLRAAGVEHFDSWAATFGSTVTDIEMGPAGGFRAKTRFAKFQNVPEMLRMWHVFADVKTGDQLNLKVPLLAARADGAREPTVVTIPPTPGLQAYIKEIATRAERVSRGQVDARDDNMLKISTEGRSAALDLRLVEEGALEMGLTKLDVVAENIATVWAATRENEYLGATGETSPIRGGMQMVFCDLGTPKNDGRWDAYHELRNLLVERGLPRESIRFIHEATNDRDKGRLFAAARAGHISVLIGSTGKMGVGTNVQDRIVAMHHVDCPWRPADLEQRDGRGIRQGNQNPEVAVFRYVVEGSFDAYSWQTVARKSAFIDQIMHGSMSVREIEDIGDTTLSAAEAKALASGNPLLLEKATADATLQKLRRQETAHWRGQNALEATLATSQRRLGVIDANVDSLRAALARSLPTAGDAFAMSVGRDRFTSRTEAGAAIAAWARNERIAWMPVGQDPVTLGELGGHTVQVHRERDTSRAGFEPRVVVSLRGVPESASAVKVEDLLRGSPQGIVQTLERKVASIAPTITKLQEERPKVERAIADAERNIGRPFAGAEALREAEANVARINDELNALGSQAQSQDSPELAVQPRRSAQEVLAEKIQSRAREIRAREPHGEAATRGVHTR